LVFVAFGQVGYYCFLARAGLIDIFGLSLDCFRQIQACNWLNEMRKWRQRDCLLDLHSYIHIHMCTYVCTYRC